MASRTEVENLKVRKSEDLCKLAEMLDYKSKGRFAINQLQCNNGAFVSSLLSFFDDNPGAMEALQDWVLENSDLEDEDEPDEYLHEDSAECKQAGDHLKSCDDDGYCNACGEQPDEEDQ